MAKKKMIAKIHYNYSEHNKGADIDLEVDLSRFEKQYGKAQYELDSMVMTHMIPYMPHQTRTFINVTKAMSAAIAGSGTVVAAAPPMGRYLYNGKVMVGKETRRPWAKAGEEKEVIDKDITYSNPKATPKWFDTAERNHGAGWVKAVKKIAGGK